MCHIANLTSVVQPVTDHSNLNGVNWNKTCLVRPRLGFCFMTAVPLQCSSLSRNLCSATWLPYVDIRNDTAYLRQV